MLLQPIKKEIASYHSKLESLTPPPVDMETARKGTSPQAEGEASIEEQAVALKSQWEWVLKQSIERKEVVEEVIGQLEQFEAQHAAMSQFMASGQQQLSEEKPIGGSPQRIKEQLDSCKVCSDEVAPDRSGASFYMKGLKKPYCVTAVCARTNVCAYVMCRYVCNVQVCNVRT